MSTVLSASYRFEAGRSTSPYDLQYEHADACMHIRIRVQYNSIKGCQGERLCRQSIYLCPLHYAFIACIVGKVFHEA